MDQAVAQEDQRLEQAAEGSRIALAAHRWHWTRDETNPGRVSVREYARSVGRDERTIRDMVNAYTEWIAGGAPRADFADYQARAKLRGETLVATEAVAKARGVSLESARRHHTEEVREVKAAAEERAERRGTPVAEEIPKVAQDRAKARKADQHREAKRKEKTALRYAEMEGKIATAMRALRHVLAETDGVDFTPEERELLVDSLAQLRALLNLLDIRLTGASDIDWDAEMAKLGGQA